MCFITLDLSCALTMSTTNVLCYQTRCSLHRFDFTLLLYSLISIFHLQNKMYRSLLYHTVLTKLSTLPLVITYFIYKHDSRSVPLI